MIKNEIFKAIQGKILKIKPKNRLIKIEEDKSLIMESENEFIKTEEDESLMIEPKEETKMQSRIMDETPETIDIDHWYVIYNLESQYLHFSDTFLFRF